MINDLFIWPCIVFDGTAVGVIQLDPPLITTATHAQLMLSVHGTITNFI